ncbi:MAG: hypothetical protein B1H02_04940 [Candidatus Latescibacteria bacterium 4484_107]|nr:MAG: hypothetical protein B1H02_04940 [Candidatus Latescibacteria bacterium 4484_107]
MSRNGRQGVTWIEVLIVLLIIGIIAVILRPRFTNTHHPNFSKISGMGIIDCVQNGREVKLERGNPLNPRNF